MSYKAIIVFTNNQRFIINGISQYEKEVLENNLRLAPSQWIQIKDTNYNTENINCIYIEEE